MWWKIKRQGKGVKMANEAKRLLELKEEIEQAKLDSASIKGAIEQNMKRLKEEFKVNSLDQAKVKLERLKKQAEDLKEQIATAVENLESQYEW